MENSENPKKKKHAPPVETWWKKGQSGNPAGKPKGAISFKKKLLAVIENPAPEVLIEEFRARGVRITEGTWHELLVAALLVKAATGSAPHLREVREIIDGARQTLEIETTAEIKDEAVIKAIEKLREAK